LRQGKRTHSLLFWQKALLFAALGTLAPVSASLSIFAAILLFIACLHQKNTPPDQKNSSAPIDLPGELRGRLPGGGRGMAGRSSNTGMGEREQAPADNRQG
jgi:hypothetical protein